MDVDRRTPLRGSPSLADELAAVVETVLATSPGRTSPLHGEAHWLQVANIAVELALVEPGADLLIGFLFGLFHDSRRENEHDDPEHGARAAALAEEVLSSREILADTDLRTLSDACRFHADGEVTDDPKIGICWDADRLDLWRVGYVPEAMLISTGAGRIHPRLFSSETPEPLDWNGLIRTFATSRWADGSGLVSPLR